MASVTKNVVQLVVLPFLIILLQLLFLVKRSLGTLLSAFVQRTTPAVVRTPEARFSGLEAVGYTFKPNYVELPIGGGKTLPRVHYVDVGPRDAKETILCLHGEPSWSFLYRKIIPGLVDAGHRVIAPDFIGFGKSDKYTHPERYTHDLHTLTLRLLLDHLGVKNMTLVCQDWGGLVGLTVVKDCPQIFSRLVIMNTGLPDGTDISLFRLRASTPFMMWRTAVQLLGTSLPISRIFDIALRSPTSDVLRGYTAPFPSSLYKAGAARWPLLVPVTSHFLVASEMQETRKFLTEKWRKPVLVMFSDSDPITGGIEKSFMRMMPHAHKKTVTKAAHFLQEQKGEEIAANINSFLIDVASGFK